MENHFYMLGGEVKSQAQVQKLAEASVGRVDTLPTGESPVKDSFSSLKLHRWLVKWASFGVDCFLLQWKAKQGFFYSNC